jgi:hypothetical protein
MTAQKKTPKKKLKPGEKVLLKALPPRFIADLPAEDQRVISEAVGKPIVLNGYEEDGRAELEFTDREDVVHLIYVDTKFIDEPN